MKVLVWGKKKSSPNERNQICQQDTLYLNVVDLKDCKCSRSSLECSFISSKLFVVENCVYYFVIIEVFTVYAHFIWGENNCHFCELIYFESLRGSNFYKIRQITINF